MGDQTEEGVVKQTPKHFSRSFLFSAVFLLIAVIVGISLYFIEKPNSNKRIPVCSPVEMRQASYDIFHNNSTNLAADYKGVQSKAGFKTDKNCLYIATNYAVSIDNISLAKSYLQLLLALPGNLNSALFAYPVPSITELKQEVELMEQRQQSVLSQSEAMSRANPILSPTAPSKGSSK